MRRLLLMLWTLALPMSSIAEESPSMEMLLFLADFVDEQGNWDGPKLEELEELENQAADTPVIAGQREVDDAQSTEY